ncbi:MAG: hypothetical protein OEU92_04150 [Alphaproteobacteria bacterium]|nr:hypothetical protein [Alphaproteobacteria bacterium]
MTSASLEPSPSFEAGDRSRRWLALGLAGMVYVIGIAGLWSMVQSFEPTAPLPLTPAGDDRALPPLDDRIDVRDARLDELIRPEFRPENQVEEGDDVAQTDLQKKI